MPPYIWFIGAEYAIGPPAIWIIYLEYNEMKPSMSTHLIPDMEGESRKALLHIRENGHVSVSIMEYQSGTAMRGGVQTLIGFMCKRAKRIDLFLAGCKVPDLAVRGSDRWSYF